MIDFDKIHLEKKLIFAILNGKVSAELSRKLTKNLKNEGFSINPEQMTLLITLYEKEPVTQQELCNMTFKDKPGMTRLIDSLEKMQLVKRTSDKKDRRSNLISMTAKGRELEEKIFAIGNRTFMEVLNDVSDEELAVAQQMLLKVLANIRKDMTPEDGLQQP